MNVRRRLGIGAAVCLIAFIGSATAVSAAPTPTSGTTCAGGPVSPGTYASLTVTGVCFLAPGTFTVTGGLTVAAGGVLDATDCGAHIRVSGGVRILTGAVLGLGGSVNGTGCDADTNDIVNGGLRATGASAVIVHGTSIDGGFSLAGGGGGTDCNVPAPGLPFPAYSDVEDTHINGGASITGLNTCWLGFIRVQVNGGVTINDNVVGDPDAIEVGLNTIHGGLACAGNHLDPSVPGPGGVPTNSFDGSPANPNVVTGRSTGQCAGL